MNRQTGQTGDSDRPGYAAHCVMRWSLDLVLRMIYETSVAFDGDLTAGIIFLALVRANTQHLSEPVQLEYSHNRGVIPDQARRPASVKSISDSLNLPYETVRRHLGKLRAAGYCERLAGRGFVVPESVLMRPEFLGIIERTYSSFHLMMSRAQRGGLDVIQPLLQSLQDPSLRAAGSTGARV